MPPLVSIDFTRVVPHCGSNTLAFEEFCAQLARHVVVPDGARFQRNGRGADLGLECAWTLRDGSVWGWQAKYVVDVDGLRAQVEESFLSALNNHPSLAHYYVCIPFEPSAAPGRGRSQQQKLADYKRDWEAIAAQRSRIVTIEWWTPSTLNDRLLAIDAHGGRRLYWFGAPVFTDDWFSQHVTAAIQAAGPRYTPELNVGHALDSVLSALADTRRWTAEISRWTGRLEQLIRDVNEGIAAAGEAGIAEFPATAVPIATEFRGSLEQLPPHLAGSARQTSSWSMLEQLAAVASQAQARLESVLEGALDAAHGDGSSRSKRFREWQAEYQAAFPAHHYDRCVHAREELRGFREWLTSPELHAYLGGALLITGAAGSGKTHSLCDATVKRAREGARSILLHGSRFRSGGAAWEQLRGQLGLSAEWSANALLDALSAAAEASGETLVIVVDALNESQPRQQWLAELPVLLADVRARWNLRLCVSCRTGFAEQVVQEDLLLTRFDHPGFAGIEFDACQSFFRHYELEPPVGPLFDPEFSNPLFLKLICKTLQQSGQPRLPDGWTGFRTVFRGLLEARDREWRTQHGTIVAQAVTKALERIAIEMTQRATRSLPLPNAIVLLDGLGISGAQMLEQLLGDELVMQLPGAGAAGLLADPPDEISFAYERLGDHLRVQSALSALPDGATLPAQMLDTASTEPGYAEALAMQLPEREGQELLDVLSDEAKRRFLLMPWLRALEWRELAAIGPRTEHWLSELMRDSFTYVRAMDAVLVLAMRPGGHLDSRWLHAKLCRVDMARRDPPWCNYLHEAWDREPTNPVRRITAAAWNTPPRLEASLHLAWLRTLCWFFASADKRVRDHATRAAIRVGEINPGAWTAICAEFLDVDDDYIVERLVASAYGTHLRVRDDHALSLLVDTVYPLLSETVRANALIRDYVRCICDLAIRRGLSTSAASESLRQPLTSEWPLVFPDDAAMAAYEREDSRRRYPRLFDSAVSDFAGDFAIYTIPSAIRRYRSGISTGNARRWVYRHVLDLGYSEGAAAFDRRLVQTHGAGRHRPRWAERIGKKYQWIALARLVGRLADHVEPEEESFSDSIRSPLTAKGLRDMDVSIAGFPVPDEQRRRYKREDSDLMTGSPSDDTAWATDAAQIEALEDGLWALEHCASRSWYPLEAHVSLVDRNVRPGDRGFRRQVWVQVRSYLIGASDFERAWRWLRSRNFDGRWMPEGWDISESAFIAEYPRSIALGDAGLPDMRGTVPEMWPRDRSQIPATGPERGPCALVPTTHNLLSEFQEDCSDSDASGVCVPVPQLLDARLAWNGAGGYVDNRGALVFSDPAIDADGPAGCFVQTSYLHEYLAANELSLLWTVLAEKQPGDYVAIPRLEYSHIRGWHDGRLREARAPVLFRPGVSEPSPAEVSAEPSLAEPSPAETSPAEPSLTEPSPARPRSPA